MASNCAQSDKITSIAKIDKGANYVGNDENDLHSLVDSNEEEDLDRHVVYNDDIDSKEACLMLGMKFPNLKKFRAYLKAFIARKGIDYRYAIYQKDKVSMCYFSKWG